ncbi:class II lanthipeptide, LchA2/BrtA2 family [Streptomyces milbemycinicus]|uniref:Class II lanthipeptide, LchA2/BrtA2 family n=1 Tax=Streptomyces milbemycinicus TaxID=476552 RepID=A0ABW8LL58_9ACTN
MQKDTDILGAWDETELVELSEADTHGGTDPATTGLILGIAAIQIGAAVGISAALCPTTKCTSRC